MNAFVMVWFVDSRVCTADTRLQVSFAPQYTSCVRDEVLQIRSETAGVDPVQPLSEVIVCYQASQRHIERRRKLRVLLSRKQALACMECSQQSS